MTRSSYDFDSHYGRGKGIEHYGNSSLFDAIVYALLHRPTKLDSFLLNYQDYPAKSLQKVVAEIMYDISLFLRFPPHQCPAFKMNELRNALAMMNWKTVQGRLEVDEVLITLFKDVFKLKPFIHYDVGSTNFLHFLVVMGCGHGNGVMQLQTLLFASLKNQHVQFKQLPHPLLLIKLPVSAGAEILPNFVLKVRTIDGQTHSYFLQALICHVKDVYVTYVVESGGRTDLVLANSMKKDVYLTHGCFGVVQKIPKLREQLEHVERTGDVPSGLFETLGAKYKSLKYVLRDCRLAIYAKSPAGDTTQCAE
jgi:hypothetical protein